MIDTVRQALARSMAKPILVYLVTADMGHLVWETGQLPLYTLWWSGTKGAILSALIHCTGGDALIAISTLAAALVTTRFVGGPLLGKGMMAVTILLGMAYAVFSEWLNVEILDRWAYTARMPVLPILDTGLAPMLQWLIVPGFAFTVASRFRPDELADTARSEQHRP